MAAQFQVSPGQSTPPEGGSTNGGSGVATTTTPIVGIVVGAVGAFGVVGLLFFLIGRSRRKAEAEKEAAAATVASLVPHVDAGLAPHMYSDHVLPPGYDNRFSTLSPPPQGWDAGKIPPPPHSPQFNPHASMYGSHAPLGHQSWTPSELGGESAVPQRVEIYTPGVDDRVELSNPPRSP